MRGQRQRRTLMPFVVSAALALAAPAAAQDRPTPIFEAFPGYADFVVDREAIRHVVVGGGARFFVVPRVAVGPEVAFMRGPDLDRDVFITGVVSVDLLSEPALRPRGVMPYAVASAGWFRHQDQFLEDTSSSERTITAGAGVRFLLGDGFFIAPEVRVGTEPRIRFTIAIGSR